MLAGAVRTYINRYGVLPGRRILFFTNNDSAYAAALTAASAGGRVEIADMRHHVDGYWQSRVRDEKIPLYLSCGVAGVSTPDHILATRLARLSPDAGALTENAISPRTPTILSPYPAAGRQPFIYSVNHAASWRGTIVAALLCPKKLALSILVALAAALTVLCRFPIACETAVRPVRGRHKVLPV